MFILKRGASLSQPMNRVLRTARPSVQKSLFQHPFICDSNEEPNSIIHCQGTRGQTRSFSSKRRKRPPFGVPLDDDDDSDVFAYNLNEGFTPGEDTLEEYLEKASLSPWVPLPETAFRKYFDLAPAEPGDLHVDLGCGDGRVNFFAHDYAGVEKSTGIDIDEAILKIAHERLAKRHPPPKNLKFIQADLLDATHPAWELVQEATIITMFFVQDALDKLRPILERKLAGKKCRILTGGYPMPTWHSHMSEVVLGTQVHLYQWGYDDEEEDGNQSVFNDDIILESKPKELEPSPMENHLSQSDQFSGYEIIEDDSEEKTEEELDTEDTEYWDREELLFDEFGRLIVKNEETDESDDDDQDDTEKESKRIPNKGEKQRESPPFEETDLDGPLNDYIIDADSLETPTVPDDIRRRQMKR